MTDPNTENTQPVDEPVEQTEEQDGRKLVVEGNDTSGYVGVDYEYRNYANETDKPILPEETVEHMKEHGHLTDDEAVEQGRGTWAPTAGAADQREDVTSDRSESEVTDPKTTEGQRKDDDNFLL